MPDDTPPFIREFRAHVEAFCTKNVEPTGRTADVSLFLIPMHTNENTTEDPAGPAITIMPLPPVVIECQELRARLAANTYKLGLMAAALGLTGEETVEEIMVGCRDQVAKQARAASELAALLAVLTEIHHAIRPGWLPVAVQQKLDRAVLAQAEAMT